MTPRSIAVAATLLAAAWAACGGRSELRIGGAPAGAGTGGSGTGGVPVDGGIVDADAPDAPPPPPPCELAAAGDPVAMLSFSSGSANASDLVVLDAGQPQGGAGARVAVKARAADANFWHPEIHLAGVRVGLSWPDGLVVDQPLTLFAFESHEWGTLARSSASDSELVLFWHYAGALVDPPSLRYQRFDTASWSVSPPVDVVIGDEYGASEALAPGPGLAVDGIGYGGNGYAVAFRRHLAEVGTEARVALLSTNGAFTLGPFTAAPATDYPGRGASVVWTGSSYLVATSFSTCPPPGEAFCAPRSIVLLRLRPPEHAGDPGGLEVTGTVAVQSPTHEPTRPRIAERAGSAYLAWTERPTDEPDAPRVIRMVPVDAAGSLQGSPRTLTADAHPSTGLSLAVNQHGLLVMWAEPGDDSLPPESPGHARLVIHHLAFDGEAIQSPLTFDVPALSYYPGLAAAGLDHPEAVLVSFAATAPSTDLRTEIFLGRLDCVP
ncbi:MAG: hypothetical protein JRI23_36000 [Deltaproteobacteria bacterium]|jgi:hypothetical protein|nr:hypothetical protein [Deltaproteobacteria bacterium]MBW2537753.1 hypothetical protein [Deltaproteobacteria bacterium]